MNRIFVLLSFFFVINHLFAQESISGVVIDADTRQPVPDVIVQYGPMSKEYDYTKSDGKFTIPTDKEEVIFFQCIGYKSKQVPLAVIKRTKVIEMELDPVYLDPILISPKAADKLLNEAMTNTNKKLVQDIPLCYLLHFVQTNDQDSLSNEIYLQYATTLSEKDLKKNMKKEKIPYKYNFMDVARVQYAPVPLSEMYGAEYHASHLFTFGNSKNNETTRRYTADSTLIILQIEPVEEKGGWAKGEIVINREDMTISSLQIESLSSILEDQNYSNFQGKKVKIIRKVGRFSFKRKNDRYYMSDSYSYYKFRSVDELGREEESSYFCDVSFRGFPANFQLRKRELSGFCQELFYFPNSSEVEFWTESIIEAEDIEIDKATDEDLIRKFKANERSRLVKGFKKAGIIAVPVLLILFLVNS